VSAELTVVPTADTFDGVIDIELVVREPLPVLWLNADELTISRAEAVAGTSTIPGKVITTPKDFVGIAFEQPLPAGGARVHIEYKGKLTTRDSSGASKQKEGDEWYVYTHFEPLAARRVFPCFDEPSFKVPWKLTLKVRSTDLAFANTPVARESDAGGGMKRVEFAQTKPLPSYLVAWAVGPFEVVDAGKAKKSGTPVRIITPKGLAAQAHWAAESSAPALDALEEYFGTDYPYGKLDVISVPLFGGAMENPGLVTFTARLVLNPPEAESIGRKRAYAEVAVHEFAHQWFGDLVTTAWWDDLWLNEAFATWMEPKIVARWQPTWGAEEERVQTRNGAMEADRLVSARMIRQSIKSNDDVENAFDGITYSKGASVIAMFERWIGPEVFQKGVRRYLREHANGNGTAQDFLQALSAEAGKDITPAFSTFLDQSGVPLLSVDVKCDAGKTPSLKLHQERYLPEGAEGVQADAQTWQIPVCVRWKAGKNDGRACTLFTERDGEMPLTGATSCPDWVVPNEHATGYYRSLLGGGQLARLLADGGKELTVEERLGLASDLYALVRAGKVPYADALAVVPKLAQDKSRFVMNIAIDLVAGLRDGQLIPEAVQPSYARFIRENFGPAAHRLGWLPKKGEDEDTRLLRGRLLRLMADQGEDPQFVSEARRLASVWTRNHQLVDPDVVDAVLHVAAETGSRSLFDTWHEAARKEKDRRERNRLLEALGAFTDPSVVQEALKLSLSDEFDPRETSRLLFAASRRPATRPLAYAFVKTNFDALVARLPRDSGARFPFIGTSFCDEEHRADVEAFFKDRSTKFTGGPRLLTQALESMRQCAAFRKAQEASVAGFFTTAKASVN
jgi:alanyl aminopeptidase